MRIIALTALFGHDPKVLVERASHVLVIKDVLIDGFMAYGEIGIGPQDVHGLFWTEVICKQHNDLCPLVWREMGPSSFPLSTSRSVAVGLLRTIAIVMARPVAVELAPDG